MPIYLNMNSRWKIKTFPNIFQWIKRKVFKSKSINISAPLCCLIKKLYFMSTSLFYFILLRITFILNFNIKIVLFKFFNYKKRQEGNSSIVVAIEVEIDEYK